MIEITTCVKPIDKFVQKILLRETSNKLTPEYVANAFLNYFNIKSPLSQNRVIQLCIEIGINKISPQELPPSLRGYNHRLGNNIEICYKSGEWVGGFRHTVFHEIYELICDSYNYSSPLKKLSKTEFNANSFSAAVLMPYDDFLPHCVRCDFNIPAIRDKYTQAYFSILLRLRTILYYQGKITYNAFIAQSKNKTSLKGRESLEQYVKNFEIINTTFLKDTISLIEGPLFDHLTEILRHFYNGDLLQDQWIPHRGYFLKADIIPDENKAKLTVQMIDPKARKTLRQKYMGTIK